MIHIKRILEKKRVSSTVVFFQINSHRKSTTMCPNKGLKKNSLKSKPVKENASGQATPDLGKTCCVPRGKYNNFVYSMF